MSERRISLRKTLPDEGGCNLCPVVLKDDQPFQPRGETTILVGGQEFRLCRKHFLKFEKALRRWRKNLVKQ